MPERPPPDTDQRTADERRVIDIRSGRPAPREPRPASPSAGTVEQFTHDDEPDDFRHRMIVNGAAFLFIAALIGAGLWLADSLASMRKNQDCVLSGKRGCSPVETVPSR
jgi:hypothetical protein